MPSGGVSFGPPRPFCAGSAPTRPPRPPRPPLASGPPGALAAGAVAGVRWARGVGTSMAWATCLLSLKVSVAVVPSTADDARVGNVFFRQWAGEVGIFQVGVSLFEL